MSTELPDRTFQIHFAGSADVLTVRGKRLHAHGDTVQIEGGPLTDKGSLARVVFTAPTAAIRSGVDLEATCQRGVCGKQGCCKAQQGCCQQQVAD